MWSAATCWTGRLGPAPLDASARPRSGNLSFRNEPQASGGISSPQRAVLQCCCGRRYRYAASGRCAPDGMTIKALRAVGHPCGGHYLTSMQGNRSSSTIHRGTVSFRPLGMAGTRPATTIWAPPVCANRLRRTTWAPSSRRCPCGSRLPLHQKVTRRSRRFRQGPGRVARRKPVRDRSRPSQTWRIPGWCT